MLKDNYMKAKTFKKMKSQGDNLAFMGELEDGQHYMGMFSKSKFTIFVGKDFVDRRGAVTAHVLRTGASLADKFIVSRKEAIAKFEEAGIDMSEITKTADPEVCYRCGSPAYKTTGKGLPICKSMAEKGDCAGTVPVPKSKPVRHQDKIGRNDLCPCGSEKKYKHCHLGKELLIEKRNNG